MTAGRIGYYVHHLGDGHRQRALAIARQAAGRITLLGTGLIGRCDGVDVVELADDRPVEGPIALPSRAATPQALHYAPIDHEGVRLRVARLASWIAEARPALMVVDVSVEVAMLARLASIPTVYVRLSGRRDDAPHRQAFAAASGLLAPFHSALDDPGTPRWVRRKTVYAPGVIPAVDPRPVVSDVVLGVVGRGGGVADGERWAAAARATPRLRWRVIGACSAPADPPPNLQRLGWVQDAAARIAEAGIVVGAAGDGLVSCVIAAGRPIICIPEPRPYGEQAAKAARLAALGAAVVYPAWPRDEDWAPATARARSLDPSVLAGLHAADGARVAASWLCDVADAAGGARP